MGNTCRLRSDDVVPLVDPSQQDAAEVDRPDAIGHLLEGEDADPPTLQVNTFLGIC